jgi:hypothetical protein
MLLEMSAAALLLMLKEVLKLARAMVVPIKAESYPNLFECRVSTRVDGPDSGPLATYRIEPVAMMAASVYNRQL